MIAERMNKYKQLAYNCILGWLIHDIWSFIEREDFPEELKKSEQEFKNRLEEIQSLAKNLKNWDNLILNHVSTQICSMKIRLLR